MQAMLRLLPAEPLPPAARLPRSVPAQGPRRARVALLAGCVQQALAPAINLATLRVLARNGVEVVIPAGQGCCGSLMAHNGDAGFARRLARRNLRAFAAEPADAIITNAAGCGSGMREYGLLFAGQPEEEAARTFAARVRDVSTFLDELGLIPPGPLPQPLRLAYHDACHLAHAQAITAAPRRLLRAIPNLTLLDIPEGDLCCGSAGTYNLEQPEIAAQLGRRKAENILATGAEALAAGNLGCLVQIQAHLAALGRPLPAGHTVEVLDQAYGSV
jgi:glycolate oxidase iron-sulfur subunit